jgi:hypothetical protein
MLDGDVETNRQYDSLFVGEALMLYGTIVHACLILNADVEPRTSI